jgi:hypothetical protein
VGDICTHNLPNGLQVINSGFKFAFAQEEFVKVKVKDNNEAEARFCSTAAECGKAKLVKGKWSTIYDQAFKVELENGQRFVANFRYNAKPAFSADPLTDSNLALADIHTGAYDSFDSKCDQTMVGFVQSIPSITGEASTLTSHKATCFVGMQDSSNNLESTESTQSGSDVKFAKITQHGPANEQQVTTTVDDISQLGASIAKLDQINA